VHHPSAVKPSPAIRVITCLAMLSAIAATSIAGQLTFNSVDEAVCGMLAAVDADDYPLFISIAGNQMAAFWGADDSTRGALERAHLVDAAHAHGFRTEAVGANRRMLYVGGIPEPFPAPLVKTESAWRFDGEAGSRELIGRRILRDEAAIVELCWRLREAEFNYLENAPGGKPVFADKVRSAPGQRDGLFWMDSEDGESPLGPVLAAAAFGEKQPGLESRPLFGYYFRILPGRNGAGVRGHFAFIAWPAEYGVGGIRSFLITQSGDVYQRDLGPDGYRVAEAVMEIHPDRGWSRIGSGSALTATRRNGK
jgi:hypothetical protein